MKKVIHSNLNGYEMLDTIIERAKSMNIEEFKKVYESGTTVITK